MATKSELIKYLQDIEGDPNIIISTDISDEGSEGSRAFTTEFFADHAQNGDSEVTLLFDGYVNEEKTCEWKRDEWHKSLDELQSQCDSLLKKAKQLKDEKGGEA